MRSIDFCSNEQRSYVSILILLLLEQEKAFPDMEIGVIYSGTSAFSLFYPTLSVCFSKAFVEINCHLCVRGIWPFRHTKTKQIVNTFLRHLECSTDG